MKTKKLYRKALAIFSIFSMLLSFVVVAEAKETEQLTACDEIIAESINSEKLFTKSSETEWTSVGDGTMLNPYLIADLETLELLRDNVNDGTDYSGIYFKMTADIDMSVKYSESTGVSWTPIGVRENMMMNQKDEENNKPFAGNFDGNGHKISGLYIYGTDDCQGLFGYISGGTVKNLTVSGYVAGKDCIGGISGWNNAVIENCVNECDVVGSRYDGPTEIITAAAGGISGFNQGKILKSSNIGNVKNEYYKLTNDTAGGICGENYGTVENCFNTGEVSARFQMGGISAFNKTTIKNCYSTGVVTGFHGSGIAAENKGVIENCYYLSGSAEKAVSITDTAVKTDAGEKTAEEFADGSVAYLLQSAQKPDADGNVPMVWGQTLTGENADAYPVLTSDSSKLVSKVTVSIKDPSTTTVKYSDIVILYADITGTLPDGARIEWTADNGNFSMSVSEDGSTCEISPKLSGKTVFTVTVYGKNGNVISSETQEMTAKAGILQRIVAFVKKIFNFIKTLFEAIKNIF